MKIVTAFPPNYDKIKERFPIGDRTDVVFTYGDTLYNPSNVALPADLQIHEQTHMAQQVNPEEWWERYMADSVFLLSQEVEAYRNQYRFFRSQVKDRNRVAGFLHRLASALSSSMYGRPCTLQEALKLIAA